MDNINNLKKIIIDYRDRGIPISTIWLKKCGIDRTKPDTFTPENLECLKKL